MIYKSPASWAIDLRFESGSLRRSWGHPTSWSLPSLSTAILSHSKMVLSLWATVRTVQSENSSLMVFWINWSVWRSTAAVASSRIRILVFRRRALAKQMSWRWPTEKLLPPSVTTWSRPPFRFFSTWSLRWDSSRALQSWASLFSPVGSRLNRRSPENRTGSCGMMVSLERNGCSPSPVMSWPSMEIFPPVGSMILNSARVRLLFPAPVLPQIPTFSPALMLKSRPLRTGSSPSL